MGIPGIMIAAAGSGSGKTVTTCAILEALRRRNLSVAAFKCGPDYIDPMFHREVLGKEAENLDLFFLEKDRLRQLYEKETASHDIAVTEGVMGYYDGMIFGKDQGSSYDVAKTLELPVILVVPCKGMALSAAAVIKGLTEFREDSRIRGVILNRISPMLYPRMKEMVERELAAQGLSVRVLGYLPENDAFRLESRHLGLVTPQDMENLKQQIWDAADIIKDTIDFDLLFEIAKEAKTKEIQSESKITCEPAEVGEKPVIAVARDEAFCFYYKDNLRLLRELGCELAFFSPLHDSKLPEGTRGILLGGGYPELYVKELSKNQEMLFAIRQWVKEKKPCLAECGGFQYLQENLEGKDGISYPMVGVIPSSSVRKERLVRFGYIDVEAKKEGMYLRQGEHIRAHEFHYWDSEDNGCDCVASKPDGKRSWDCIHMDGSLCAGYPHLYYRSFPAFAQRFVDACRKVKESK